MSRRGSICIEILNERIRQDNLKAAGRFPYTCADIEMPFPRRLSVLVEEVGRWQRK